MKIARYILKSEVRLVFYSIQVVWNFFFFITGVRFKDFNRVCLFISTHPAEKVHFSRCFIQNLEEIKSLKNEKVLE